MCLNRKTKLEYWKKKHTDTGKSCTLHTENTWITPLGNHTQDLFVVRLLCYPLCHRGAHTKISVMISMTGLDWHCSYFSHHPALWNVRLLPLVAGALVKHQHTLCSHTMGACGIELARIVIRTACKSSGTMDAWQRCLRGKRLMSICKPPLPYSLSLCPVSSLVYNGHKSGCQRQGERESVADQAVEWTVLFPPCDLLQVWVCVFM